MLRIVGLGLPTVMIELPTVPIVAWIRNSFSLREALLLVGLSVILSLKTCLLLLCGTTGFLPWTETWISGCLDLTWIATARFDVKCWVPDSRPLMTLLRLL